MAVTYHSTTDTVTISRQKLENVIDLIKAMAYVLDQLVQDTRKDTEPCRTDFATQEFLGRQIGGRP